MSPEFLLLSLAVVVSPGAGAIFTLSIALSRGAAWGIVAAFGCTLGIVPHLLAALTGVAAFLHANAVAFEVIRYLGIGYLLYMAWDMLRQRGALRLDDGRRAGGAMQVVTSAVLINLLNPKLSLFFLAFLPQFIDAGAPDAVARMLLLSAVFMLMTLVVFILYGVTAALVRRHLVDRPRILGWIRRGLAAAFVALGVRLILQN